MSPRSPEDEPRDSPGSGFPSSEKMKKDTEEFIKIAADAGKKPAADQPKRPWWKKVWGR